MVGTRGLDPAITGCAGNFWSRFSGDTRRRTETRAAAATLHRHHPAAASGAKAVARHAIQGSPTGSRPAIGVASETATSSCHTASTGRSAKSSPACSDSGGTRARPARSGPASTATQIPLHATEAANAPRRGALTSSLATGPSQAAACSAAAKGIGSWIADRHAATAATPSTQAGSDPSATATFAVDATTAATRAQTVGPSGS